MNRTEPPAGRVTRYVVAGAIAIAALSGTSASLRTALGTPTVAAAQAGQAGQGLGDRPKGTVWVVNRDLGRLAVFDAVTGDLLAPPLPVGRGAHDICISEQNRKAYITAEMDNVVTVVDTETLETQSIPVGPLPHHVEPSNDGHTIYVSLASHPTTFPAIGAPQFAAIDTRDNSVTYHTSSLSPNARSHGVTPTLEGDKLYVAHDTGNEVTGIDLETGNVDFTVPGILRAEEVIPSRSGDALWVSSRGDGSVKRIDLVSHAITASVPVGVQPESIMLTPNERTLVVGLRGALATATSPGTPAKLGFVDTTTVGGPSPVVHVLQIAGVGSMGDLAVLTPNGHYVFATYDNGMSGTGGVVVVDVRTQQIVNMWEFPGTGRPHGIWYSRKAARF
jgi:DNA-binding beta-propeller fold protein YncE